MSAGSGHFECAFTECMTADIAEAQLLQPVCVWIGGDLGSDVVVGRRGFACFERSTVVEQIGSDHGGNGQGTLHRKQIAREPQLVQQLEHRQIVARNELRARL